MTRGAYYALFARGRQDEWMDELSNDKFHGRDQFLNHHDYQRVYAKLECTVSTSTSCVYTCTIYPQCDLINNVDMYITCSSPIENVNDIITSIETTCGGMRLDILRGDMDTIINTNAEILRTKRIIRRIADNKLVIPLHMAPFYDSNLVSPSLEHHQLTIIIKAKSEISFDLFADCYYVVDKTARKTILQSKYEFVTLQHQSYCGKNETVKKGTNVFKLNFNHPVHCMYFWGFDKSKVQKVTLHLNTPSGDKDAFCYFQGGIDALEYNKHSRGITADPVMMFFSDMVFDKRPKSTINFTRLDSPILVIETEQEEETKFHLIGLNIQGCRTSNGMMGLVYAK